MARFQAIRHILTLHCDEASRLSSESLDHPLSGSDRLAWSIHLWICGDCRRHRRDIQRLRELAQQVSGADFSRGTNLSEEDRERIKNSLKREDLPG